MKFLIMIDKYKIGSKPKYFGLFKSKKAAERALKEKGWGWHCYSDGKTHYLPDPKKNDLRYATIISDHAIKNADLLPFA